MAKLLCTIWALMLNSLNVSIFKTCFANAMEDDYGEPLTTGPPITSFLFAAGVYVILVKSTLFPQSFRKPNPMLLCFYEVILLETIDWNRFLKYQIIQIFRSFFFLFIFSFFSHFPFNYLVSHDNVLPGVLDCLHLDTHRCSHANHSTQGHLPRNVTISRSFRWSHLLR